VEYILESVWQCLHVTNYFLQIIMYYYFYYTKFNTYLTVNVINFSVYHGSEFLSKFCFQNVSLKL
jgi:hypothetical protein